MGIEENLSFTIGDSIQLGIKNKGLFRKLSSELHAGNDRGNDFVILDDKGERIDKNAMVISDIFSFEVDNRVLVERLIKKRLLVDERIIEDRALHDQIYKSMISSIISELNLLEVEYDYINEFDVKNVVKLLSIDFSVINDLDPLMKIENVIRLYSELEDRKVFIIKNAVSCLKSEDILELSEYVCNNQLNLVYLDYVDESDAVVARNLFVSDNLDSYSVKITAKDMI